MTGCNGKLFWQACLPANNRRRRRAEKSSMSNQWQPLTSIMTRHVRVKGRKVSLPEEKGKEGRERLAWLLLRLENIIILQIFIQWKHDGEESSSGVGGNQHLTALPVAAYPILTWSPKQKPLTWNERNDKPIINYQQIFRGEEEKVTREKKRIYVAPSILYTIVNEEEDIYRRNLFSPLSQSM